MSDPACTCPIIFRRLPHNSVCPRSDADRAWSIEDRQEQVSVRLGRELDTELGRILGGDRA